MTAKKESEQVGGFDVDVQTLKARLDANDMFAPFARAFWVWENDFRANPGAFMTATEVAAMAVLPLSEQRAACFVAILDTLAGGKPWMTIGETCGAVRDGHRCQLPVGHAGDHLVQFTAQYPQD